MNSIIEKVAEVRPDVWGFLNETRDAVRESPFRDEIFSDMAYAVKVATDLAGSASALPFAAQMMGASGKGSIAKNIALGAGALIGVGIANSLAGDLYDAVRRGLTKSHDYKKMVKSTPELLDKSKYDPSRVRQAFDTLHRFNPEFAGDPFIAGSFVRRNATYEGGFVDPTEISNLVSARKNLQSVKSLPMPSQIPLFDRESPLDKAHKSLQTAELRQRIQTEEGEKEPRLRKLKAEADRATAEADKKWLEAKRLNDRVNAVVNARTRSSQIGAAQLQPEQIRAQTASNYANASKPTQDFEALADLHRAQANQADLSASAHAAEIASYLGGKQTMTRNQQQIIDALAKSGKNRRKP